MNCVKCQRDLPEGAIYCCWCGKKQIPEKRKALKRANGTGTVYKLPGRRSRPWVAAKNKVVIGYYARKTDALEALERLSGRDLDERYNMTFADVFREWSAEHYPGISKGSIAAYDIAFRGFEPLHNRKFRDLRTADFQAVIDPYMSMSHSTVAKYKHLITQMSQWAIREELISTNFASFVRLNENARKEKEIFTDAEVTAIESDSTEAARVVSMLLETGMRIGELFALTTLDYHGDYVIGGEKTEAGKNRIIPIRPAGREHFAYFAQRATGPQLLSGYEGQHTAQNFRKRDYSALLERLGIPYKSPHATRHTYTSRAVKEGMAPEILQKILGHADYSTTANVYTHLDAETLVKAVEKEQIC